MTTEPTFTARIVAVERLTNSTNGNPRFRIAFDNGAMHITQSDAAVSYEVENLQRKADALLDVWTTGAGRITRMAAAREGAES